jgi:hypothetical protein
VPLLLPLSFPMLLLLLLMSSARSTSTLRSALMTVAADGCLADAAAGLPLATTC